MPSQVGHHLFVELAIDYVRINSINSFHNCRGVPKIVRSFSSDRSIPRLLTRSVDRCFMAG